ncbi:MAG: hypothetical protein WCO44_05815 [Bacteroidota bacterium]
MGLDIVICVNDIPSQNLTQMVSSVEVNEKMDQNSSYKLKFMVDVCDGDIANQILNDIAPGKIVSVLAKVNEDLVCLVKGPVAQQEAHLVHGGAGSWIHVEGEDTGQLMDHITNFAVTTSGSDADIASRIISGNNDMSADVQPTPDSVHDEDNHSHVQRDTDLNLLRSLARRNGFHFWITWDQDGLGTGHFKARDLSGTPSATLIVNQEDYNIDSLRVTFDTHRPSHIAGRQLDLRTKTEIVGNVTLDDTTLGSSSLADVSATAPESMHLAPTVDNAGAMDARARAVLRDAQWFITATCSTNLHRLCNIVRFHTLVQVQGAGTRYSGKYYVTGVKHLIDAAAYKMELELARNAWGN